MFHLRQLFNRILFFQVWPVLLQVRVTFEGSNYRGAGGMVQAAVLDHYYDYVCSSNYLAA